MSGNTAVFAAAWKAAEAAGMVAGMGKTPAPMIVTEVHFDDTPIEGGKSWFVGDGVCGFAWVSFPGNTSFGKWAKKTGKATPGYPTGLSVWVHQFNQSYERKMAYATAMAASLAAAGFPAHAGGRLD